MENRRQREKEKQISPIYPWDRMCGAAREAEEQPHKLLPLHETPTGRNNLYELISPFLTKKYKESRRKTVEEQGEETTLSPTNSSKEHLSAKQIPQKNF